MLTADPRLARAASSRSTSSTPGDFPLWLAPVQAVDAAESRPAADTPRSGHRAPGGWPAPECGRANEKLNLKIREAELRRFLDARGRRPGGWRTGPSRRAAHGTKDGRGVVALDAFVLKLSAAWPSGAVDLVPTEETRIRSQAWRAAAYQGRHPDQRGASAREIRVVDEDGTQLGVDDALFDAVQRAWKRPRLVEVAPGANRPCVASWTTGSTSTELKKKQAVSKRRRTRRR